jgi:hypothetical protein
MTTGSPYDIADWRLKVTVTGVKVEPKCARPNGPQRGHRAVVAVRVETSPTYTPSNGEVSYFNWSTISPDGVSEPAVSTLYECNETKELFTELRPTSKYVGEITIDTANTSGYVVLGDSFAWPFPA